ncbi:FHA domain-containing protein [Glaciimonas soli]|uniref:FHA domain-containing protein n=1 Tax=Glaciimonas soli TaxID=2590999 RepID=UPI001884A42C|nr:FHA domain-containing protein [Glaciimonas soli]
MAIFECTFTHKKIYLRSPHIFGRSANSDTHLEGKDISQLHASVKWNGVVWEIFDHSRNGTMIDGALLLCEKKALLNVGTSICFGRSKQSNWTVEKLTPPCSMLLSLSGDEKYIELQNFNLIPNEIAPEFSIYRSETGQWVWECNEEVRLLRDGDQVSIAGTQWKFFNAGEIEATSSNTLAPTFTGPNIFLHFHDSWNGERVSLKMTVMDQIIDLGERVHHYCLIKLARKRLEDAKLGVDSGSQGWMDLQLFAAMLGLDVSYVNTHIFRIRNQLAQALPDGITLPNIIERRRDEVRLGSVGFEIINGSVKEGIASPTENVSTRTQAILANEK